MGGLQQCDGSSRLECFQYQHLSLVVPRNFGSNPVFVVFPEECISVSIFQCHPVKSVVIAQQSFSSSGGKQQHPGLGYSPLPLPCGGVCWPSLMVEDGRTWMQDRECKSCSNLKLEGNALKSCTGQPWGEQCTLPVRLILVTMGTTSYIPLSNRNITVFKKKNKVVPHH